jgi:hypothetical protein
MKAQQGNGSRAREEVEVVRLSSGPVRHAPAAASMRMRTFILTHHSTLRRRGG